ncbi:MAG: hypothetical protein MZV63_45375 [Marinilabiliales bacterium]|nr:hypothetical protein [Marinilabiliales bacterium]
MNKAFYASLVGGADRYHSAPVAHRHRCITVHNAVSLCLPQHGMKLFHSRQYSLPTARHEWLSAPGKHCHEPCLPYL